MAEDDAKPKTRGGLIGLLDQGISSATNLLAVLAVAASLNASGFGIFSVVYGGLTLALGLGRSYLGLPIALEESLSRRRRRAYDGSFTLVVVASAPMAVLLGTLGWAVAAGHDLAWIGFFVAVATPFVVVQDLGRFEAMAQGRQWLALASDGLWLFGAAALWVFREHLTTQGVLWTWVATIMLAAAVVTVPLRPRWDWPTALSLVVPGRGARESASIAVLLSAGGSMIVGLVVAAGFGPAGAGALRGAGTLMGVINTLIAFLDFGVLIRLAKKSRAEDRRVLCRMLIAYLGVLGGWTAILLLIPSSWGELILGETWAGTRTILPITAVEYIALISVAVMGIYCKLRDRALPILVGKVASTSVLLAGSFLVVLVGAPFIWIPIGMVAAALVGLAVMALSIQKSKA